MANSSSQVLQAEPRTLKGKQVKQLRPKGLVPAAVSSRDGTMLIQFPIKDNEKILNSLGLITLEMSGKPSKQVLVKQIERAPLGRTILHVDFTAVEADQKIKADVPIVFSGTPAVEEEHGAILMRQLESVSVQCLPGDLPQAFIIDLSTLTEPNQTITVADLQIPENVTVTSSQDAVIAALTMPQLELEPEPVADEELEGVETVAVDGEGDSEESGEGSSEEQSSDSDDESDSKSKSKS